MILRSKYLCGALLNGGTFRWVYPTPLMTNINDHRTNGFLFYYVCRARWNLVLRSAFTANIWITQCRGRTETFANGFAGTNHQHDNCEGIRQHLQKETKIRVVIE